MIDLWPHWFRPWWLLLLPLLGWLLWQLWHRQKRAGRWQMILPPAFHAVLLSGGNGRESKSPWVVLGIAWLLAVLALLGPSWQRVEQASQKPSDPLVVLLELTPEMLATDSPPNRLEQARRKLYDLLQARSDAQTAIVVYAGSAHTLVPLSDDLATSRNLLEALRPSIMPEPGHRADLAVQKALDLLKHGGLGQGRLLLIGSSLSKQERQGIRLLLQSAQSPSLSILGIGSREGTPVTQESGEFLKDEQGAILVPRLAVPRHRHIVCGAVVWHRPEPVRPGVTGGNHGAHLQRRCGCAGVYVRDSLRHLGQCRLAAGRRGDYCRGLSLDGNADHRAECVGERVGAVGDCQVGAA